MHLSTARLFGSLALLAAASVLARPARAQSPAPTHDPTTVCKDGTAANLNGSGSCGAHGGVDSAATSAARAGAQDAQRPPATGATLVICGDGTSSTAGNDACLRHGGIKAYPGQRGPVKAALQMEDEAQKWAQQLPPALRAGAVPKPDTAAAKPASPPKPDGERKTKADSARKPKQR